MRKNEIGYAILFVFLIAIIALYQISEEKNNFKKNGL